MTIPAKKIIGCRYFAKCNSLNLLLGVFGNSGFSKGAAIPKSLGTTAIWHSKPRRDGAKHDDIASLCNISVSSS